MLSNYQRGIETILLLNHMRIIKQLLDTGNVMIAQSRYSVELHFLFENFFIFWFWYLWSRRSDWVALAYEAKQIIKECRTEEDQTIREYIDEKKGLNFTTNLFLWLKDPFLDECTQNVEAKCRRMPLLTSVFIHPNAEAKNDGTIKTQMIVDDTQKLEADKMDNQSNSRKSPDDGDQGIVFNTSLKKLSGASGSIIRDETFCR